MSTTTLQWIPYPRPGTHVEDGRWLCTTRNGVTLSLSVQFLQLERGVWWRQGEDQRDLSDREEVVAIAYPPEPYQPT